MTVYLTIVSVFGRLCDHTTHLTTPAAAFLFVFFSFVAFGFPLAIRLRFYLAYLYMLILDVRKELSHSDWLFASKRETNP